MEKLDLHPSIQNHRLYSACTPAAQKGQPCSARRRVEVQSANKTPTRTSQDSRPVKAALNVVADLKATLRITAVSGGH
ncbi:hypothetical protein VZT92_001528 [Zoarces viviparus]|uniref:Uncharacterized protein n=1 Tax=Zoarces viviparus TaxID=48416 RepID=A0AAW1G480_ZOAVI